MRIAQVAHGWLPIPAKTWGAIESIIWHQKLCLERLGHSVDIANTHVIHKVIHTLNDRRYDFVQLHCELHVLECIAHLRCPFAITSHAAEFSQFEPGKPAKVNGFEYLFDDMLRAPANIALSERIRDIYLAAGYAHYIGVLRNGVEVQHFRVAESGNGKAVCIGVISARKRQGWLAAMTRGRVPIDFVGPWNRSEPTGFVEDGDTYLGVWDRSTLYDKLTDYSCLVLLSGAEAAPKVVLEALAAGVSIVISDACSANLSDEEFITVVPTKETRQDTICQAIQTAIDQNAMYRRSIREYALARFDQSVVVAEYVQRIEEVREYFASGQWTR